MTYQISKNQNGVSKGKVRYEFYLRFEKKRYRKTIICQKSIVGNFYKKWEHQIYNNLLGSYSLFEKLDEYLKHVLHVKSKQSYNHEKTVIQDTVKVFYDDKMLLQDFKRHHLDDYLKWRKNNVLSKYDNSFKKGSISNATLNRSIAVLSSFFNWCIVKDYFTGNNPCYRAKLKENNKREVRLSIEQVNHLLEKAYHQDERLYNIIVIELYTGMRRGEILSLTWDGVDFDRSLIFLSKEKTKTNKARTIPIISPLKNFLLTLKNNSCDKQLVVQGMSRTVIQKEWNKLREKVSFNTLPDGSKLRFHDLRHVVGQTLLDLGIDMKTVQDILGHSSIKTTEERYVMFARPDLNEKMERLSNVIKLA